MQPWLSWDSVCRSGCLEVIRYLPASACGAGQHTNWRFFLQDENFCYPETEHIFNVFFFKVISVYLLKHKVVYKAT